MNGPTYNRGHTLDLLISKGLNILSIVIKDVALRHGTITGSKVYRGLEKTVSKPLKFFVIPSLRNAKFCTCRQRHKVQDSLSCVQWRVHESHGPSGWCEAASSQ